MLTRGAFRRDRRSAAAMEFAFIAPVLLLLLLGTFEIANAALVYEEVQNAAHSIPASASNLAVTGTGATALDYAQIQLAESEIWGEIPELRSGFQDGQKSVTMTSVVFIQTFPVEPANPPDPPFSCDPAPPSSAGGRPQKTCKYTPTVVWSVAYAGGDSKRDFDDTVLRSCDGRPDVTGQQNATVQNTTGLGTPYVTLPGGLNSEAPPAAGVNTKTEPRWRDGDLTSLPTFDVADKDPNLVPPSPILVVDVHLRYKPIFGLFIKTSGIDFYATGMWPVRSVQSSVIQDKTVTAQTLTEQFTTIIDDNSADAAKGILPDAPGGTYCINTSRYLDPGATSESQTS